jgi:hypothetical protein
MSADRIIARYLIETPLAVERAAEVIAGEQSSGTFVPVPGETEELKKRVPAQVVAIALRESVPPEPSLPGARPPRNGPGRYQRAEITVAFPPDNVGSNLPDGSTAENAPRLRTLLGTRRGDLLARLIRRTGARRVCVAGGDTSGMVSRRLGIAALEVAIPIAPGARCVRPMRMNPPSTGWRSRLKGVRTATPLTLNGCVTAKRKRLTVNGFDRRIC